jgi:cell wall-associated NlpC family hydrolase
MSNNRSLRPATRVLLAVATASAGVLALPAGAGVAATPAATTTAVSTAATPAPSASTLIAQRTAARRAARLERERIRRERRRAHRRAMRKHRREVRAQQAAARAGKALRAFHIGQDQKGDPYVYGATGPNAFDCSGLTSYAYHRAGLSLPRTAASQAGAVRHIPRSQLRLGDLVFFESGGHVYHVGLFAGRHHGTDYVLHAPRPGESVRTEAIWTNSWFAGTER